MCAPNPGMGDSEEGVKDRLLAIVLDQSYYREVCAGVGEESSYSFPATMEG